jgi:hypothetical protein
MNLPPPNRGGRPARVQLLRPRPESKLGHLNAEQHLQLCQWLLQPGLSLKDITVLVKKEFGIDVKAKALSNFYRTHVAAHLIVQRQQHIDVVCKVNDDLKKNPVEFVPATLDALKRLAWRLSNSDYPDAKILKIIYELVLRSEEQEIKKYSIRVKARRMDLLEKKQKQAEAAAQDSRLSDTEFADRMRQIFRRHESSNNGTNGKIPTQKERVDTNGITA